MSRHLLRNLSKVRLFCIVSMLIAGGCGLNVSAPQSIKKSPVGETKLPISATINLGVLGQGESSRIVQWIRNTGDKHLSIVKIDKSCECLDVRLGRIDLAPGDQVLASFSYEGAREPHFVGSLLINVELSDTEGSNVGKIDVSVEVVAEQELPK